MNSKSHNSESIFSITALLRKKTICDIRECDSACFRQSRNPVNIRDNTANPALNTCLIAWEVVSLQNGHCSKIIKESFKQFCGLSYNFACVSLTKQVLEV